MRSLVIYCYYEKDPSYKENLKYFLKKGVNPKLDYIFVINGICTFTIPTEPNIRVLHRKNSGYDFGAYHAALTYVDTNDYDYYFFMNTSVRGPFLPPYVSGCWTRPFIDLLKDDVMLVGTTINVLNRPTNEARVFLEETGFPLPFTHVQSMMFAMRKKCLVFLKEKGIFAEPTEMDFVKVIAMKEILMSQLVLRNGWNLSCLIPEYQKIDYRKAMSDPNPSSNNGDPNYDSACFYRTIHPYEVIFVKSNRGVGVDTLDSLTRSISSV
jgi:hypothetical protein